MSFLLLAASSSKTTYVSYSNHAIWVGDTTTEGHPPTPAHTHIPPQRTPPHEDPSCFFRRHRKEEEEENDEQTTKHETFFLPFLPSIDSSSPTTCGGGWGMGKKGGEGGMESLGTRGCCSIMELLVLPCTRKKNKEKEIDKLKQKHEKTHRLTKKRTNQRKRETEQWACNHTQKHTPQTLTYTHKTKMDKRTNIKKMKKKRNKSV